MGMKILCSLQVIIIVILAWFFILCVNNAIQLWAQKAGININSISGQVILGVIAGALLIIFLLSTSSSFEDAFGATLGSLKRTTGNTNKSGVTSKSTQ